MSDEQQEHDGILTDNDLKRLAMVVAETLATRTQERVCESCICQLDYERHKRHHRFIDEMTATMSRVRDLHWASLKAVAAMIGVSLVVYAIYLITGFKIKP